MAAELIALIGDVNRFANMDKFLAYTGIALNNQGTGETETRYRSKYGRRDLMAVFHRIACTQQVANARTGELRNPEAKVYFGRLLGDQAAVPSDKRNRQRKSALATGGESSERRPPPDP